MHLFLIADDHHITRLGLIEIIKSSFTDYIIEEAENGRGVLEMLVGKNYDILITDLGMPETDPDQLVEMALAIRPKLKILVLSMGREGYNAPLHLQMGALGYIEKDSSFRELAWAIRTVLSGSIYLGSDLVKNFVTGNVITGNPFLALSAREREICTMICQGRRITEIAAIKQISVSTVGTHKSSILKKLGVGNLVDLFNKARFHSFLN